MNKIVQKRVLIMTSLTPFCRIGHDNKGGFAGWFLDKVIIDVPSLGQRLVFPCGRWLDKRKDDGQLERELVPGVDAEESYTPCKSNDFTAYWGLYNSFFNL